MKIQYYKSMLDGNKYDMKEKKTWSILKQAIGKQNDNTSLLLLFSINGQTVTNKLEAADGFNDYFSKIGGISSQMARKLNVISKIKSQTQFCKVCF